MRGFDNTDRACCSSIIYLHSPDLTLSRSRVAFYLQQIVLIGLLRNHIKERLRAEPPCQWCTNRIVGKGLILIIDLDRLVSPSARSSVSHQLRMAALIQTDEPENCCFNSRPRCQETVVL